MHELIIQMSHRNSILYHLHVLNSDEYEIIDDFDCWKLGVFFFYFLGTLVTQHDFNAYNVYWLFVFMVTGYGHLFSFLWIENYYKFLWQNIKIRQIRISRCSWALGIFYVLLKQLLLVHSTYNYDSGYYPNRACYRYGYD